MSQRAATLVASVHASHGWQCCCVYSWGACLSLPALASSLLPHAEVVAHVQQYQVLPGWLVSITATFLPWIEVGSGTALLVGFYTTPAALLIAVQLVTFSALMVIVLAAGIPIEDCGCFGNLGLPETPLQVLIRDLIMLVLLVPLFYRQRDALGLDAWSSAPASSEA